VPIVVAYVMASVPVTHASAQASCVNDDGQVPEYKYREASLEVFTYSMVVTELLAVNFNHASSTMVYVQTVMAGPFTA
jgi:hypothetical protein